MYDLSGALVRWDGPEHVSYALVQANGTVLDWAAAEWVARTPDPLPMHLRAMSQYTYGPASWSQDVVPRLAEVETPVTAMFFVVDDAGMPTSYAGSYMLDSLSSEVMVLRG